MPGWKGEGWSVDTAPAGVGGAPVVTAAFTTVALPIAFDQNIILVSATNSPTSWSITANPGNYFWITSAGQIYALWDSIPPQSYALTVQATNASGNGSAVITVSITSTSTIYYVATNGSDANNGLSISSPFLTIEKAASVVNAGNTVLVRGGLYRPAAAGSQILFQRSGTITQPIVFAPYGAEQPIIDGTNSPTGFGAPSFMYILCSYMRFQGGFIVEKSRSAALAFWGATGCYVFGNTFRENIGTGIYCGGSSDGSVIMNNIVTRNSLNNEDHALNNAGGWGGGIGVNQTTNTLIKGNLVYNNWGEGIAPFANTNVQVIDNVSYDNYSCQIYPDQATNFVISGNLCYWSGDLKWGIFGDDPPEGIRMARETNQQANNNILIFNNIVVGLLNGISSYEYGTGGGAQNCKVYNNTLINCRRGAYFEFNGNTSGNELRNNIFSGGQNRTGGSAAGWTCTNNCWDGVTAGPYSGGASDITANPSFVGTVGTPGSPDPLTYRLNPGSPCKLAGANVFSTVAVDYAKAARPSSGPFSIGAYQ